MTYQAETKAFADRLRKALEAAGVRLSATRVAEEFNARYWGKSVTPHTARNWLIGKSLPTQDKLRVLADWLQVSPDELRFGGSGIKHRVAELDEGRSTLEMPDREMLRRFLQLQPEQRKLVREIVSALLVSSRANRKL